ncbi:hypothetical protein BDK51DRAFT_48687 [Blyttiomyces helicus]|uniref:Uncharacterized protein n=1 Tax=Blyttiomyces helicus TaxID=388810 RepID=A0A4P9W0F9_9FUNG|nr:hypothetical protein BDK51DRAFT_48687 [Blyttiomyces helicus]|eukprot:RKO84805.1 hypothetical protein BDK51DRAFT_48687 [Blyttiomyces helicus]
MHPNNPSPDNPITHNSAKSVFLPSSPQPLPSEGARRFPTSHPPQFVTLTAASTPAAPPWWPTQSASVRTQKEQCPKFMCDEHSIGKIAYFLKGVKACIATLKGDPNHSNEDEWRIVKPLLHQSTNTWFCACQLYQKNFLTCLELKKIHLDGRLNEINIKFCELKSTINQVHGLKNEKKDPELDYINSFNVALRYRSYHVGAELYKPVVE